MPTAKKAPKKPAVKAAPATNLKKNEITVHEWNWANIPSGSKVIAVINGRKVNDARVYKYQSNIYVCNNVYSYKNGCPNQLGYKGSMYVGSASARDQTAFNCYITEVTLDPKFVAPVPLVVDGRTVTFNKTSISVGCKTVPFNVVLAIADQIKQLQKLKK